MCCETKEQLSNNNHRVLINTKEHPTFIYVIFFVEVHVHVYTLDHMECNYL